jgi:mono/diheme cytochrome c family protein
MRWGWLAAIVLLLGTAIALAAPAQRELGELIRCGAYDQFPMREQQAPERDQGPDLVERGRQLVERAECGRCHALPATVAATPRQRSCAGCHAWIHGTGADPAAAAQQRRRYPLWDRYVASVASFLDVPDLTASGARLDPAFVARYLRAPFKVRPTLAEGMIRTGFDEEEARAVSVWLASTTSRSWSALAQEAASIRVSSRPEHVAQGRRLYQRLACHTCHAIGEQPATGAGPPTPDLTFARQRLRSDVAAAFIADPASFGGETRMPRYPITALEAARLRDYLWAPRNDRAKPVLAAALPLLTRPVAYAEVRAQVLDRICIHCHMDPKRNGGDGGPGNTGGLGYRGAGLDLETWAGIQRGAVDGSGQRRSILTARTGQEAPLVARLRLRYGEHARERSGSPAPGGTPGMPLGLPPLTPAQFQLVRSWVAQGAPGPARRIAARGRTALRIARGPTEGPRQ